MLTARIKIGSGEITDSREYGLVYLDSDKRTGPDTKDFESTSYPEEEGEHILAKTVLAPFDYTVKFFVQADTLDSVNDKIAAFNALLYDQESGEDVMAFKQVALYNDTKRHKIVGVPKLIAEATDFFRDPSNQVNDIAIVEWTIRVTKPSLCEFKTPFSDDSGD